LKRNTKVSLHFQNLGSACSAALGAASFANETSCLRQSRHNQQRERKKVSDTEPAWRSAGEKKKARACRAFLTIVI
jgi:hypothetical protein